MTSLYRIGDVCTIVKGTYPSLKTEPGRYPLVVTASFRRTASTYQLEGPAVCVPLISSTGHGDAALHRVHYQEGRFALANLLVALLPKDPNLLCAKYLYHLLMAKKDQLLVPLMLGTANVSLKERDVAGVVVALPPLDEQRRIMARIEVLAAKIEEARGLRREALEEASALLTSALRLVFEVSSSDWGCMPMTEAIAVDDRQVDPRLPEYGALPHISGDNIESKTCRLLPHRTAEQDNVRSGNYLFFPGTILYSKIRPYLQKAAFVNFKGVCSADIYPIKVISTALESRFVMWSLVAAPFTEYANRLSGRTRMPKLNRKQLFAFCLSYPERTEQGRIVAYLDGLQAKAYALKRVQAESAAELDALLPAVMERAFRGEL